ncbi:MAG: hypothetical protein JWN17_2420 [Frankiales bacterium]|nr:hypothetical protein [Frankiales bacterium]
MGLFDQVKDAAGKATELAGEHSEQVQAGIEKAGDAVDDRTDGRFAGQVDKAQELAADRVEGLRDR